MTLRRREQSASRWRVSFLDWLANPASRNAARALLWQDVSVFKLIGAGERTLC
ncbi:MAG: hypothetical protein ACFCAD_28725 [Pleurocapsa sp.]